MQSLLEAIKKNQAAAVPVAAPVDSAQVSSILQTKATGKAVPANAGTPAASNMQEQQAQQGAAVANRAAVQEGQGQQAALGAAATNQQAGMEIAEHQQEEQVEDARSNLLRQTTALLDEYQQGARTLDATKDKARLEQIGFGLRLTNDSYLSNLQREGKKSRLNSDTQFQEELTRSIFADEEELMRDDLNFRAMMRADDREFQRELANLSIADAIRVADAESKAANTASQWSAAGSLASAGVEAGAQYAKNNPEPTE